MKRIVTLTIAVVLCTVTQVRAQICEDLTWGVRAGAIFSSTTNIEFLESTDRVGFTAGLFVEYRAFDLLSLSFEGAYSERGFLGDAHITESALNLRGSVDQSLSYVDMAILAKLYIYRGLSLNVGVMPSFLLDANGDYYFESLGDLYNRDETYYRSVVLSIPMGVSYKFDNGILIDLRYNLALQSLNSVNSIAGVLSVGDARNNSVNLTLGFGF